MTKKRNVDHDTVLRCLYDHRDEDAPTVETISRECKLSVANTRRVLAELVELGMISGPPSLLESTQAALHNLDDKLKPTASGYAEAVLMLAAVSTKADDAFLAEELGYDKDFAALVGSRLRSAGIWIDNKVNPGRVAEWEKDGIAFWLDHAVACGNLMVVGRNDGGDPLYQMTESGMNDAAELIERMSEGKS